MPDDRERDHSQVGAEEPGQDITHEPWVNQHRHEPMPASKHADRPDNGHRPADGHRAAAAASEEPDQDESGPEGKAVRDMMGGPPPQGDVPDAPATQIAAAREPGGDEDHAPQVTYVANAVPGKPDGEVDTRS